MILSIKSSSLNKIPEYVSFTKQCDRLWEYSSIQDIMVFICLKQKLGSEQEITSMINVTKRNMDIKERVCNWI